MKPDHPTHADPNQFFVLLRGLLTPRFLICLFVLLLLFVGIAWRQLDASPIDHVNSSEILIQQATQSPTLTGEINEQTRESNGIILATVVIVLIVIGGTFGATRHKTS
jgi:hypothetical protein